MTDDAKLLRNRYELGERLGGSADSATFEAVDRETGERCVVKALSVGAVLQRDASLSFDPDDFTKVVELFEREARVLAHLDHPGIPRFIDHFTDRAGDDTTLYTVQEFVAGKTLEALVAEGRHFTEAEVTDLCRRVVDILGHLHGRSPPLIHRDIKPSNIVLDERGGVHLLDFGAVRNWVGGDQLDGKTIVGTYGYMPIEQYEARALPQSDFYALGMTLLFVLSHRPPTEIPRVAMNLEFRPFVSVSDHFASVLERMIEPAPEDRYGSAAELLGDLDGRNRSLVPAGGQPLAQPWSRSGLFAAAVLAVALAGVIARLLSSGPMPATAPSSASAASGSEIVTAQPPAGPVSPRDGLLAIDIYRDFRYMPVGWPMGRSVGQTPLPALTPEPFEDLRVPAEWSTREAEVLHGFFPLGNGPDSRFAFALVRDRGVWSLSVDLNNNEDLTDDGPPVFNEGSGKILAAEVAPRVEAVDAAGTGVARPYHLWTWFNEPDARGRMRGYFYARHHYRGAIAVGGETFHATAFEFRDHDALYRDSGICIDLSADGTCQEETELFRDGDVIDFGGRGVSLALRYP